MFSLTESILVLTIVIAGGAGTLWGPLACAGVLLLFQEGIRYLGFPSALIGNARALLYGAALVACMLWRPQGLIGEYDFGRETKRK